MPIRAATAVLAATLAAATVLSAGCSNDGRELRPPRSDQNQSILSIAPPTTVASADTLPAP
jgi:hypothetical protein